MGGTLEGWPSSHLDLLFLDFFGVGCAEEEEASFLVARCSEGECNAGRFKMAVIERSGLLLSARLRFELSSSPSAVSNLFFRPTTTSSAKFLFSNRSWLFSTCRSCNFLLKADLARMEIFSSAVASFSRRSSSSFRRMTNCPAGSPFFRIQSSR